MNKNNILFAKSLSLHQDCKLHHHDSNVKREFDLNIFDKR